MTGAGSRARIGGSPASLGFVFVSRLVCSQRGSTPFSFALDIGRAAETKQLELYVKYSSRLSFDASTRSPPACGLEQGAPARLRRAGIGSIFLDGKGDFAWPRRLQRRSSIRHRPRSRRRMK